jgi:3-methyladenine DNA glycosylase AlkD
VLHPAKDRVTTPLAAAAQARRTLRRLSRSSGGFDARRYFRATGDLRFLNVRTPILRRLARTIVSRHGEAWGLSGVLAFAGALMVDPHLEVKHLGVEALARYRGQFTPPLLGLWKSWLARNDAANWATTDAICGSLIGPLLLAHPSLGRRMPAWAGHANMWVRRASAVALIPSVRRGRALAIAYDVARRLHADGEDLIRKAVGWMLREAGKTNPARLERYLRAGGSSIPRTTVRYAIERFPAVRRRDLLAATKRPRRARP